MIMDKETLNKLLDSIYELEGLVHLALTRDDNPERLPELISKKGEELANHASQVALMQSGQNAVGTPKPKEMESQLEEKSIDVEQEVDRPLYVVDSTSPIEEDMQSVVESVFDALPEEDLAEETKEDILVAKPKGVNLAEDPEETHFAEAVESREPRGKLVFSINDRYRFKRELFNNSDADFNNTLALVASMEDYDEAEDYFLDELQWDSKRGEVIDFLEILKRYYKE